jgi:hypothetical protein
MSFFSFIYEQLGAYIEHLPDYRSDIAKSVWDALDREAIADIILDGNVFWFETHTYGEGLTDKQHEWLVKHIEQHGYKYLHSHIEALNGREA